MDVDINIYKSLCDWIFNFRIRLIVILGSNYNIFNTLKILLFRYKKY